MTIDVIEANAGVPQELPPTPTPESAIASYVAAEPNLETVTLALPRDALEYLRLEANKRNVSTGEMVRIAIGVHKFLSEQITAGGAVQVRSPSGVKDVTI